MAKLDWMIMIRNEINMPDNNEVIMNITVKGTRNQPSKHRKPIDENLTVFF